MQRYQLKIVTSKFSRQTMVFATCFPYGTKQCFKGNNVTQGELCIALAPRRQGVTVPQGEWGPLGCLGDAFETLELRPLR